MSDYTPTTEDVRISYVCQRESIYGIHHDGAEFDRWLTEVKAEAWEEGRLSQYLEYPRIAKKDNPYV